MVGTVRSDKCPNCGTYLRWQTPDELVAGSWTCPKCKYRRFEGSERKLPWLKRRRRKNR